MLFLHSHSTLLELALDGDVFMLSLYLASASRHTLASHTPMTLQHSESSLAPLAPMTLLNKLVFSDPMGLKKNQRDSSWHVTFPRTPYK